MRSVVVIDKSNNKTIGDAIIHLEIETDDNMASQEDKIDLVPEEGFIEDTNEDNSKKYTCKQCAKVGKTEHSIKQHIAKMHKNKPMKRSAPKNDNNKKRNMKPFRNLILTMLTPSAWMITTLLRK